MSSIFPRSLILLASSESSRVSEILIFPIECSSVLSRVLSIYSSLVSEIFTLPLECSSVSSRVSSISVGFQISESFILPLESFKPTNIVLFFLSAGIAWLFIVIVVLEKPYF